MERRACSTGEIAELVVTNSPAGASGFYVDFKHPSGSIERQPPEGAWSLKPVRTISGIFEGFLHVHYVDKQGYYMKPESAEQRLVIDFIYGSPERRPAAATAPAPPALESLGALADKLSGPPGLASLAQADSDDEEDASFEDIAAMQGSQKQQLQILSMDTLQTFMRDSLSHIVRLQEAATKNSQAQIETSIVNLRLLSEQSTKLLETQLTAARITKERVEELQSLAPPTPLDVPGILGSVLPFLQTLMLGGPDPDAPRLPPRRLQGSARPGGRSADDIVDGESVAAGPAASRRPRTDRTSEVVQTFRDMLDPEKMERLARDPLFLDQFMTRLRSATAPEPGGSESADGP